METSRRTQSQRTQATRTALVAAARPLFAERGYAEVGAEEIVRAAGVTRGALYHHFGGKEGLFEAVYLEVEAEITRRIAQGVSEIEVGDPVGAMRLGVQMFLDVTMEPGIQRIVLLDAPAVLGWERWREIGAEYGLGMIESILQVAMDEGALAKQPVTALAHVLMGALDETAMMVARAEDPRVARAEAIGILDRLIEGLRPQTAQ
jgi:AcrR family transcriptional regulator